MEYKVITTREDTEVGENPNENSLKELVSYFEQGFTIQNFSSTHVPRQDRDALEKGKERPTKVFIFTSYLLSK